MDDTSGFGPRPDDEPATAFAGGRQQFLEMTAEEHDAVAAAGTRFAQALHRVKGPWLLIKGGFTSGDGVRSTESRVRGALLDAFGYPKPAGPDDLTLNVLLDSSGGSLDSAYSTVLSLYAYAAKLKVYVPDRAKSASTLLALGADEVHMSAFSELGPLDTQIRDPRNPANTLSALDCYQSVDYVRDFGIKTMTKVLPRLVESTERQISVGDLLGASSGFTLGAVQPMLNTVTALDFGGWGRSLRIGEQYARRVLRSRRGDRDEAKIEAMARRLVFEYTHHLFPIDYHEAADLGLAVVPMDKDVYTGAVEVLDACKEKWFVGFLSRRESERERKATARRPGRSRLLAGLLGDGRHPSAVTPEHDGKRSGVRDASRPG